jgi:CubicO group peptidase (beta-lactamase class C family)
MFGRTLLAFFSAILVLGGPSVAQDRLEKAASYSASKAGDALLIWQRDSLVLERYQNEFAPDKAHLLASGTKTFSGLLAWAAVADGLLALDERVAETLPAWNDDPQRSAITVRQLLHLTSGLDPGGPARALSFDEALKQPLVHPPGEGFRYGPAAFQAFGALLQRKLGEEDPTSYLQRRILSPIGAEVAAWTRVDGTDPKLGGGAKMTARDWLRVGRLLLQDGQWNGKAVLPAGLRDTLATPRPASPGYGLTIWLNAAVPPNHSFFNHTPPIARPDGPGGMIYADGPADLFMAAGAFNQRLYVVPSREMVVVRFGRPDRSFRDAELLARLLDGRAYEAPERPPVPKEKRVAFLTNLQMVRLDSALTLTEAQEATLRPIVEAKMTTVVDVLPKLKQRDDLSRRKKRRLFRQLRRAQRTAVQKIEAALTDKQTAAYRDVLAEQRERMRTRWGQR